mgnify:CR=1 FL=1
MKTASRGCFSTGSSPVIRNGARAGAPCHTSRPSESRPLEFRLLLRGEHGAGDARPGDWQALSEGRTSVQSTDSVPGFRCLVHARSAGYSMAR